MTITRTSIGAYDMHIAGDWEGEVTVTLPKRTGGKIVVHRLGTTWVRESEYIGDRSVTVSQLSPFAWATEKVKVAVCFKTLDKKAIAKCLLGKGVKKLSSKVVRWLADQFGIEDKCVQTLITSGNVGLIFFNMVFSGDCRGNVGFDETGLGTLPGPSGGNSGAGGSSPGGKVPPSGGGSGTGGGNTSYPLGGDRIAVRYSDGTVAVKENGANAPFTTVASGGAQVEMAGDRIGVLYGDGTVAVKDGIGGGYTTVATGAAQLALAGDRIAVRFNDGTVAVKDGIGGGYTTVATGAAQVDLAGDRIAVRFNDGTVAVKDGIGGSYTTIANNGAQVELVVR